MDVFDEENLRLLYERSVSFPYVSRVSYELSPPLCNDSYGLHTQMLLVSAYVIAALFYEVYKRVRNNEDIEPYNRNLLSVNILIMLPGLSMIILITSCKIDSLCTCTYSLRLGDIVQGIGIYGGRSGGHREEFFRFVDR